MFSFQHCLTCHDTPLAQKRKITGAPGGRPSPRPSAAGRWARGAPPSRIFTVAGLALLLSVVSLYALAAEPVPAESGADRLPETHTAVVDLSALAGMDTLITKLAQKRVVFVGESHDRYEDHLNQLTIIAGLHVHDKDLAIGMEFFQQPFQGHLDAYIAGEITELEMLRRTDYFERWRFDYKLYRPILRFAREHGIPLIALNLEREITSKVGDGGIESLSEEERSRIPAEMDRDDDAYRARLKSAFSHHPDAKERSFENFLSVQLLWDEGMAERAARYLVEHPEKSMVILAGSGHLEYGQGIPNRLSRRVPAESAILLSGLHRELDPEAADYLLFPRRVELPGSGLLGVFLDTESEGEGIGVNGFSPDSGAEAAGLEKDDRIVKVGEEPIRSYSDIRIALMDSRPGQKVALEVRRARLVGEDQRLTFEVELH